MVKEKRAADSFVLSALREVEIFAGLDNTALNQLGFFFKENVFEYQETIFEEGSIGDSMMIIASGEVRVSQKVSPDAEEALIVLKKGDVFGEMGLFEDMPRSATTIAHTNVILLAICRDDFLNYIRQNSETGVKILLELGKILSARLRETDVKLKAFVNLSRWL